MTSVIQARTIVVASGARYRHPRIADIARFEGPRDLVLGVADRSASVRRRRGRSGRRRQFSRSRRGVSLRSCVQGAHDGERAGLGRKHVALSDRSHHGDLEHRTHDRDGDRCVERRAPAAISSACGGATIASGQETEAAIRNVFLFVGADPATEWLQGCVALDKAGFVTTGIGAAEGVPAPSQLQSSVPGVFAVGDVRSGSVKRVGGAIGEGAQVVAAIHKFLGNSNVPHL